MRISGKYPPRIVTSGVDATTIMQGSKRAWSYDSAGGLTENSAEVFTPSFTRWISNRGQGNQVVAFRFGVGDVDYGNVVWRGVRNEYGENKRTVNGITCLFVAYGTGWGGYSDGLHPSISAFSSIGWHSGLDPTNFRVYLEGLVVGRSYAIQAVLSDHRNGANLRTFKLGPTSGMAALSAPTLQPRYAYEGEDKYCVYQIRFIATATTVSFRPDIFDANGAYAGVQINALNLIQNVLPQGKMFYVANDGNDNNDGMSRDTAWASLSRVHERTYGPGDCILFKRGHKWTGRLSPAGNGESGNPIILSAYGDGAHPLIEANGAAAATPLVPGGGAIELSHQSHWIIDGFECTNWPSGAAFGTNQAHRTGIHVSGSGDGIVIRNCYVHDVLAAVDVETYGRYGGGIRISGAINGQYGNFAKRNGVLIENNVVENIMGLGIFVAPSELGETYSAWQSLMWTNVVIRGNRVHNTSVDSILVIASDTPLMEHNHSSFTGMSGRFGGTAASSIGGIWAQYANAAIQQFNHCHDGKTWQGVVNSGDYDGQALGIDYNMAGESVIRYNYVHDVVGGMAGDYNFGAYNFNASMLVHHNISVESSRVAGGRNELHFGNIYYSASDPLRLDWSGGVLSVVKNIMFVPTVTNPASASLSDNLWHPVAKPSGDISGQSADPIVLRTPEALIFRDAMICYPANNTFSVNSGPDGLYQREPRWYGALGNQITKYVTYGAGNSFRMGGEGDIKDYRTMKTIPSAPGFISLNSAGFNFYNYFYNSAYRPITVRLVGRSVAGTPADNWLALCVSSSPFPSSYAQWNVNSTATDYGILFRSDGQRFQSFCKGAIRVSDTTPWAGSRGPTFPHVIELVFTGGPVTGVNRVSVYSDGLLIDEQPLSPQLSGFNVGLENGGADWRILGFEVFHGLPQDRFRIYESLVPTNNSALLPATSVTAPAGAKDFIGNTLAANPKRGAYAGTSLSGYNQTPTRIEVRGRYSIAKPSSGNRKYNYDAIIRDQNNRIIKEPIAWAISPAVAGVTIDAVGVVTVAATAGTGRFAIKASSGAMTNSFPCEII